MRRELQNPSRDMAASVGAPPLWRAAAGLLHRRIAFGIGLRLRADGRFRPAGDGGPLAATAAAAWRQICRPPLPAGAVGRAQASDGRWWPGRRSRHRGGGTVGGDAARACRGGHDGGGGAPPQGDSPFVPDEIVTAFVPGTTPQAIAQFAQRTNLAQLELQNFPLIGTSLYRWRIGGGRSVPSVVQALGTENIVATVQPNYLFALQEDNAKEDTPSPRSSRRRGRCRSICPGRAANRAGASDRDRKIHHGCRDRLRNRRETSRPRRRGGEKLRRDGRQRHAASARHLDRRRHCRARQAHRHRAGRADLGGACLG